MCHLPIPLPWGLGFQHKNFGGRKHSDHNSFFPTATCCPTHWVTAASCGPELLRAPLSPPQCGNVPYIANVQEFPTKVHCGEEFRTNVGRSFIPPLPGCPSPWPKVPPPHSAKAGICTRTLFTAGLLSVPYRRSTQGKEARQEVGRLCQARAPQASGSMSPAEETGVGLAMRSVALMSRSTLPCNIMSLSRWVLSISLLPPLVCSQK